ncbi:hypothetical protein NPA31_018255, partial [Aurantimonas sp. MSK8Z-1]|uniref:hypothetical protein n=1 Tax=Mangrovibrevibacter kandeliae TaxID=2968473 RepID=UPI00222EF0BC
PTPPMPPAVSPAAAPRAPAARLAPGTAAAPAMPPPVGPVSKLPPASVPDARPAPPVRREPVFEPVELDDERPAEAYGAQEHGFVPEDGGEDDEATGYVDPYEAVGLPAADVEAPRYAPARRVGRRSRVPLLAASALVLLLGGGAAVGWIYRDDLQALLNGTGSASPSPAPVADTAPATPAATTPATSTDTQVASAPPAAQPSAPADGAQTGTAAPASAAAAPEPRRRFTQRLLADGSEVDAGPAKPVTNDFDEGTEVAEASPVPEDQPAAAAAPDAGTVTPDTAATGAPAEAPAAPAAGNAQQQTAALQPQQGPASIAVGQRAVFYEERSNSEPATQQTGNVVWTLVNEAPAEGQPPEPAIHAVADVPDENLKMTMTIRRNSDVTLPASHVIELSFEVPSNFQGGEIANVQRLALKPTEQARGEPLIGVAGKISDGFFIIALNNLQQATDTNLDLLMKQEWIDIPVAYSNGRRALLSIEKGLPGDRVFEQAISAWKAKT